MWAERNGWSDHGGSCRPLGSQIRVQIRKSVKYNLYSPMEICSQLLYWECCYCSVTKSMSNSLQPHGLQHSRFPCPSLSPRVFSNSRPLHPWCCLTISSSVVPFSSCSQFSPASGSFRRSWPLLSGGQKHWSFGFSISPSSALPHIVRIPKRTVIKKDDLWDFLGGPVVKNQVWSLVQESKSYMTQGN